MYFEIIQNVSKNWYLGAENPVSDIIDYIKRKDKLRDTQIEAIEVYLFLKIACGNRPLWELFSNGNFLQYLDLGSANINQEARSCFETNTAARMVYELSLKNDNNKKPYFPSLTETILNNPGNFNSDAFLKNIFYGIDYPDYLFSLPMGAGKTFLMAAFIYLDLYFSYLEPENFIWAKNFLVLVPSGLKSSIIPSLRTIEEFDPTWVLSEPSASRIKKSIHFEVLDQPKTGKKSNRTDNPNVAKLLTLQPFEDLSSLVMLVNAEKVILNKIRENELPLELTGDEDEKQANELRHLIGEIPNKLLLIDEVHHATDSDIKLRGVVNNWHTNNNVTGVLGFSGTPYLSSPENIELTDSLNIKTKEISNVVYYYPLIHGISNFLKKPTIGISTENNPVSIIKRGIEDFKEKYGALVYRNGSIAKIAIYCGNIERLEEEIYPYLIKNLKINPDEILKFHKGNSKYKVSNDAEYEFRSLDLPYSKKRYILLVQVGKEGWDCRSLTGVILSNKGDCPTNMVLQTSCRCLREVEKSNNETAIIWLNKENASTLDKQLANEQKTSIEEINKFQIKDISRSREQVSRMEHLYLPVLNFYQIEIRYEIITQEEKPDTNKNLNDLLSSLLSSNDAFKISATISKQILGSSQIAREVLQNTGEEMASFSSWLISIVRDSIREVTLSDLEKHQEILIKIFEHITYEENHIRIFNHLYHMKKIENAIRTAFYRKRELKIEEEIVPKEASLLLAGKLKQVTDHSLMYPTKEDQVTILDFDGEGTDAFKEKNDIEKLRENLLAQGLSGSKVDRQVPRPPDYSMAVLSKERTFHYIPYDFKQSRFEKSILEDALLFTDLNNVEIYYNGEKYLTEFRIDCMEKRKNGRWKKIGMYTPDFLLLKRDQTQIHKVLIVETKGSGFAEQSQFMGRRNFVENEFLKINNEKFGYSRFDYLYLSDADKQENNLNKLVNKAREFFKD